PNGGEGGRRPGEGDSRFMAPTHVQSLEVFAAHAGSAVRAPFAAWRLGLTVFATGLFGIGFETVGVRVLAQVLENTVYTFAAVLSVFLFGTSIGAALYQRFGVPQMLVREAPTDARAARALPQASPGPLLGGLLGGISLSCL